MVYTKAVAERYNVRFGAGSGEVLRVVWNCEGTEKFLLDCPTVDANYCNSPLQIGAGVYCFGKQSKVIATSETRDKSSSNVQVKFQDNVMMGALH